MPAPRPDSGADDAPAGPGRGALVWLAIVLVAIAYAAVHLWL